MQLANKRMLGATEGIQDTMKWMNEQLKGC
jgi:hypothetical protein